jgi:hypothetical protein
MNFLTNFGFSVDYFLTYNFLTIASFRIGVPSIFFSNKITFEKEEKNETKG